MEPSSLQLSTIVYKSNEENCNKCILLLWDWGLGVREKSKILFSLHILYPSGRNSVQYIQVCCQERPKIVSSTYLQFCTQHYINVRFIRWFGKIFNCVTENQLETGDREFRSTSFSNFKAQTNPPTLPELSGFDVSKLEFQCALLLLLQIAQTLKVTSIFTS